ncbi:hypothetical protein WICPIJ_008382 [Wickerhamomyces pijperi]|uniref:Uncharacterized protein n=1 Tax=Wickerhamomyces pijperi TaxID=599730 RepID=A0A9P8PZL3_WICPI|nr:hypothetical protein WICPIJ_008382 [Wickerhamomyces pijperi]
MVSSESLTFSTASASSAAFVDGSSVVELSLDIGGICSPNTSSSDNTWSIKALISSSSFKLLSLMEDVLSSSPKRRSEISLKLS